MAHRLQIFAERLPLHGLFLQPQVGVVVQLVGRTELASIKPLQPGQRLTVGGLAGGDGFQAVVGPAVVEAFVALERGRFRILAQAALPFLGEERVQASALVGLLGVRDAGEKAGGEDGRERGDAEQATGHRELRRK